MQTVTVKDLENGSAILQLRRDILNFLNLNKNNDFINIQIDESVRYE